MTRAAAPRPVVIDKPPTTAAVANARLRDELLAMLVQDQAVRTGVAPPGDPRTPDELAADWDETDRTHNARMAEVLDEHGWRGWRSSGATGRSPRGCSSSTPTSTCRCRNAGSP